MLKRCKSIRKIRFRLANSTCTLTSICFLQLTDKQLQEVDSGSFSCLYLDLHTLFFRSTARVLGGGEGKAQEVGENFVHTQRFHKYTAKHFNIKQTTSKIIDPRLLVCLFRVVSLRRYHSFAQCWVERIAYWQTRFPTRKALATPTEHLAAQAAHSTKLKTQSHVHTSLWNNSNPASNALLIHSVNT